MIKVKFECTNCEYGFTRLTNMPQENDKACPSCGAELDMQFEEV